MGNSSDGRWTIDDGRWGVSPSSIVYRPSSSVFDADRAPDGDDLVVLVGPGVLGDRERHAAEAAGFLVDLGDLGDGGDDVAGADRAAVDRLAAAVEGTGAGLGGRAARPLRDVGGPLGRPGEGIELVGGD